MCYDSLLRAVTAGGVLVGYAHIVPRDVELTQLKLNSVIRIANVWMSDHGLLLALNRTEIVLLIKKRTQTILRMRVEEVVETKSTVKYAGLIDNKLCLGEEIRRTADRAAKGVLS